MSEFTDHPLVNELTDTAEPGTATEVHTMMPLMETSLLGLMEKLETWQRAVGTPNAVVPTAEEIHAFRHALADLEDTDREAADRLERSLQHLVVSPIIARHKNEVDEYLARLSTLRGGRDTWNVPTEGAMRLLEVVSQLTSQDDTERKDRLRQELQRLAGETWLSRAEGILANGKAVVQLLENRSETTTILSEAQNITLRLAALNREAQDAPLADTRVDIKIRIAPEIMEKIGHLQVQANDFNNVKRRQYEGAVTADIGENYELALADLEFVREMEGSQARVRYFPDEQSGADQATHIPVDQAIKVCKLRWSRSLEPRARNHVDRAREYLEQGNPNAAYDELDKIVREDILPESQRNVISDVKRETESELGILQAFHDSIGDIDSTASAFAGWRRLIETGMAYEKYQAASSQWRETRQKQAEKVRAEAFGQLKTAIQVLVAYEEKTSPQRLAECGASAKQVSSALSPWPQDFQGLLTNAHLLSQLADDLGARFERIKLQLQARQLSEVQETLNAVQASIEKTRGQLANELAGILQVPREYHRVRDVWDSYRQADRLLDRLSQQVAATEQVTQLNSLREEIAGHCKNVDERYRPDFERLSQYAEARYHFYAGRLILNQAGDPEEARSELTEAAKHDEFRTRAQAEVVEIERRLVPAERRVSEALDKMDRLTQQAQWWDAYQEGIKVEHEPAQKSLRQRLTEKIGICRDRALNDSLEIMQQALRTRTGDPTLLRDHSERVSNLDPKRMAELKSDLWLLIYVLETEFAVKNTKWSTAHESIQEAIKIANEKEDTGQVQELETRAKAIEKQYILSIAEVLESPSLVMNELNRFLAGRYAQDADLLMTHVEFTLRTASQAGEPNDDDPGEGAQWETTAFRQAREQLLSALPRLDMAVRIADTWRLMGQCPDYERWRARFLGRNVEEVTSERLQKIDELRQRLAISKKLILAKLDIVQQIRRALMPDVHGG